MTGGPEGATILPALSPPGGRRRTGTGRTVIQPAYPLVHLKKRYSGFDHGQVILLARPRETQGTRWGSVLT